MNPKSMSFAAPVLAAAALLVAPGATRAASPESGRAVVAATADRDQNRILVRWQFVEGGKAYAYFDVARRPASGGVFVQLNDDPIGPESTAEESSSPSEGLAATGIQAQIH